MDRANKGLSMTYRDRRELIPEPTQRCDECGAGPFFLVPESKYPTLCGDCRDERSREENGWTPANSID